MVPAACDSPGYVALTVEPPPPEFMPTRAEMAAAQHREIWVPHAEIKRVCGPLDLGPHEYTLACYVRRTDLIFLPSDWPSAAETAAIRVHEHGHRKGWRHPPGHVWRNGKASTRRA